jgi:hypothetical protein
MPGSRTKLINCGFHEQFSQDHHHHTDRARYLRRRRSTMITVARQAWLVHVGNVLPRLRIAHASEPHHVGHDRSSLSQDHHG